MIGCQLTVIQVNVRLIHWYADFYNALQKLDVPVIVTQIGVFFALAGAAAGLYLIGRYVKKVLQIRWRRRLTDTLVQGWTSRKAFWFLGPALLGERAIDNPDQRIAEDCNLFCEFILGRDEGSRSGVLDFAMNLVGLYTYATLLWQLSNFTLSFNAAWDRLRNPEIHVLGRAALCDNGDHAHSRARPSAVRAACRGTEARSGFPFGADRMCGRTHPPSPC